ncbi:MAG: autotransporter-associated beta strand repeat-containing protein [Kiritimatiellae bacterium]|nr:autotransporter-associated beta strand repeat-containing protein [Kiritimatiellia bacterium]
MKSISSVCSRAITFATTVCIIASSALGAPPVLRWNGSSGNVWDTSTANWLDAGSAAVTWQPGAEASFEGSGGIVNISADVAVSNLTFTGNGYTLLGAGSLAVEGTLFVEAGTTNCVAARIGSTGGLSKTGAGALSLAGCNGALAVQGGTLIAAGSSFIDADISIAGSGKLLTLGDPDNTANLLLNPGFELPAMINGTWSYVSAGNIIANWSVTKSPHNMGRQNTAIAGSPWNSVGSSPEGVHMLIMQYGSAVEQSVNVPADGIYSIAFTHLLRKGYPENQIYVTLDGVPLVSFLNRNVEFNPGRFSSTALYLKAGSHTLGFSGEGQWSDRASMLDAVCFAPPSAANACRALAGDSVLKSVTGATVQLNHTGTLPLAYLAINGSAVAGTFNSSHASGIFNGNGALSCTTPGDVYTWSGTGRWSENSRWLDSLAPPAGGGNKLLMRFPATNTGFSTNDLAGAFLCNRLTAAGTLAGNPITLTNSIAGRSPVLRTAAPGTAVISAPLTAYVPLTLDVIGELSIIGNPLTLPNGSTLIKTGSGNLTLPTLTNTVSSLTIYDGFVKTPTLPPGASVTVLSQAGKRAGICLTEANHSFGNRITLRGSGLPTIATRAGGSVITDTDWIQCYGATTLFDVGAGDTLSIVQLLAAQLNVGVLFNTTLIKEGPGTLEIHSGGENASNNRAYLGGTILRNGTLALFEDDYGTLSGWSNPFNGRTYNGKGGSLGYNALTNAVTIGDASTQPNDDLALVAGGDGRWIGHNIEVMNAARNVTLGMTAGTVMFAGTLTLHRDITLAGPADGIMVFGDIVAAPDYSGSGVPTLSGLSGIVVEGAVPAELSLLLDGRSLSFGTLTAKATTLNALVIGSASASGELDIDFDVGINDTIDVTMPGGLTISNTVVNLYYARNGTPSAEAGTYTLFTYAAPLGGNVALLSVGNPQAGAGCAFSNDNINKRILLTISNTSGGASAVWKKPGSGSWDIGANWDIGSVPDAASVTPLFGLAIANPSTVTLGTARTVGGLAFNNFSYGYTLTGGSLTLDAGGATPLISVGAGRHTLDTTLSGTEGVQVAATAGAALLLTANAVVNTPLALAQGTIEIKDGASVTAGTTLSDGTSLRVVAPVGASLNSLHGAETSTLEFSGAGSKLTVNQSTQGTFAGVVRGDRTGKLIKTGAESLVLNNPYNTYAGLTEITAGTVGLKSTVLPGAVAVNAAGTLAVQPVPVNGLTGYYYNVTPDVANYTSLAAMEAHFAALTPALVSLSGAQNTTFDFGWSPNVLFPMPYGSGGSRTTQFEAVWRGVITVPLSGVYKFGVTCDDGFVLAVSGQTILKRNYYTAGWSYGAIRLEAGPHDMVLGYFQGLYSYGLTVQVTEPGSSSAITLPNSWLTPYSTIGTLSGSGALTFTAPDTALQANQSAMSVFSGTLSAPVGALLTKGGAGLLELGGAGVNSFNGDAEVRGGVLVLGNDERLGDTSIVNVHSNATFAVAGAERIGGVAGSGKIALGNLVYFIDFFDDASTGISPNKTYTHLLDFGTRSSPATVINGVSFNKVTAQTGNIGGYGWANFPPFKHGGNVPPGVPSGSGIYNLLYDMNYGWKHPGSATMQLTGLTPGKRYEVRLYNRCWGVGLRVQTFTFDPDGAGPASDSVTFNPDAANTLLNMLIYRYTAEATTLDIIIESWADNRAYHLYGISNEEVPGVAPSPPMLTVVPAAGQTRRFAGNISGKGSVVKAGAGTQIFSGTNTLAQPLSITAGTAILEAGASLQSGAVIMAGAALETSEGYVTLGGLSGEGTFNTGGMLYFKRFTSDADCGISPGKTYTHLLDFGNNANKSTVNGVVFNKVTATSGSINGFGWSGMPGSAHGGGEAGSIGVSPFEGIYKLIYDMNYNLKDGTMSITGLTIGKWYELRLYNRRWASVSYDRTQTFIFDPDGAGPISDVITFNPDSGDPMPNDNYLGYRYQAASTQLDINIHTEGAGTYHLYGLSNEEANGALKLNVAGSSVFDGTVIGSGSLAKNGTGSLIFTGHNTYTGSLSVNAGGFGVAGAGSATAGPVTVAAGATLFGDGLMGGRVIVHSNAVIHAGTAAACGTLEIGDGLVIAPGALPLWRYSTGASDMIVVNGPLVFPTNGVLQVTSLTAELAPPGKRALFTSTQSILGADDLTGWRVEGATNSTLVYNNDRTIIYFTRPCGTLIIIH